MEYKKQKRNLKCTICDKEFLNGCSVNRHMKSVHNIEVQGITSKPFTCVLCGFDAQRVGTFEQHIKDAHDYNIVIINLTFRTIEDFESWKVNEEKLTDSYFVRHRGKQQKGDGCSITRYYCNRSGSFTSHGANKHQLKSQGSSKIGGYCPARIIVNERCHQFYVTYCNTHFGHERSLGHIPLSRSDKQVVADLLSQGLNIRQILEKVRSSVDDRFERLHLLTKKDIENIRVSSALVNNKPKPAVDTDCVTLSNQLRSKLTVIESRHIVAENSLSNFKISRVSSKESSKWEVKTLNSNAVCWVVKMAANTCCSDTCHICHICIHQYMCSCLDALKHFICEHIHLVAHVYKQKVNDKAMLHTELPCDIPVQSKFNCKQMESNLHVETVKVVDEANEKEKTFQILNEIASTVPNVQDEIMLKKVNSYLTLISSILNGTFNEHEIHKDVLFL